MRYSKLYSSILKSEWAFSFKHANAQLPTLVRYLTSLADRATDPTSAIDLDEKQTPAEALVTLYDKDHQPLQIESLDEIPKGTVAVVDNIGTMLKYGGLCSYGTTEIAQVANFMLAHPNVKGLVERSDSGGGAVDSIAPMRDFKLNASKPIVTLADLCASANLYSAVYSDHIMADNNISAEFGSIGVMVSFLDFQEYLKKEGITEHVIYAPESEHKNRDFMKALEGDYAEMEKFTLSPLAKKFQKDVQERLPKLNTKKEGILSGRMFYAEEALEDNLIHSIGNMDAAIEMVHRLAAGHELKNATL